MPRLMAKTTAKVATSCLNRVDGGSSEGRYMLGTLPGLLGRAAGFLLGIAVSCGIGITGTAPPVPDGLDWDLWLGPVPARPYHPAYTHAVFRGWCDFGTGALGDAVRVGGGEGSLRFHMATVALLRMPPRASESA